jgi:superfamily II DNA/RNA helicase
LALVLASTRELVQQIEREVKTFNWSMEGFNATIIVKGTNIYDQRLKVKGGVEVVIATLG